MINDVLNQCPPTSSGCNSDTNRRLDAIEAELAGIRKTFGTGSFTADDADIGTGSISKVNSNSIDTVSIKAQSANIENLDIDGPINMKDLVISNKITSKDGDFDRLDASEFISKDIRAETSTIDNLIVGQIKAKDNNTLLNNVTINGTASIDTIKLANPYIVGLETETFKSTTSNITNGNITHLAGVEDAKVLDIFLDGQITKKSTIKTNMMKSLNETSMQIGDNNNQVLISGESRPLWNDKPLAVLDDLGEKLTPAYKGRLATKQELPTIGNTVGDYYIITMLTKGDEPDVHKGIGYALYNGVQFDTDFFYELDGYRLAADQDLVDNAQDTAIENEVIRAKGAEQNLFNFGTRALVATDINTENYNIDEMFGETYFGKVYTGIASDWKGSSTIPEGAKNAGFSLEILANKHNTIQRYTINLASGPKVWMRSYGNKVWSQWKEVAFTDSKVEDSLKLEGKTLNELRQLLFDDAHPVDDTFVSSDGADDPNTIYNKNGITSTWTYIGQSFGIHGWKRTK